MWLARWPTTRIQYADPAPGLFGELARHSALNVVPLPTYVDGIVRHTQVSSCLPSHCESQTISRSLELFWRTACNDEPCD